MPRKPGILKRRGIRLPETARPGFDKLPPEEQAAAARRDVEHFIRSLRAMHADRARADAPHSLASLDARLRALEISLAWLYVELGLDREGADRVGPEQ